MWSSDSGVTEFTVILSKHYMCFMIKPVRVSFTPTINNQAAQRWTVSVSWLCRHRRGGLRASCSCLTHLSGSSTLSLRKRRTRDTRSSFLLFTWFTPQRSWPQVRGNLWGWPMTEQLQGQLCLHHNTPVQHPLLRSIMRTTSRHWRDSSTWGASCPTEALQLRTFSTWDHGLD